MTDSATPPSSLREHLDWLCCGLSLIRRKPWLFLVLASTIAACGLILAFARPDRFESRIRFAINPALAAPGPGAARVGSAMDIVRNLTADEWRSHLQGLGDGCSVMARGKADGFLEIAVIGPSADAVLRNQITASAAVVRLVGTWADAPDNVAPLLKIGSDPVPRSLMPPRLVLTIGSLLAAGLACLFVALVFAVPRRP